MPKQLLSLDEAFGPEETEASGKQKEGNLSLDEAFSPTPPEASPVEEQKTLDTDKVAEVEEQRLQAPAGRAEFGVKAYHKQIPLPERLKVDKEILASEGADEDLVRKIQNGFFYSPGSYAEIKNTSESKKQQASTWTGKFHQGFDSGVDGIMQTLAHISGNEGAIVSADAITKVRKANYYDSIRNGEDTNYDGSRKFDLAYSIGESTPSLIASSAAVTAAVAALPFEAAAGGSTAIGVAAKALTKLGATEKVSSVAARIGGSMLSSAMIGAVNEAFMPVEGDDYFDEPTDIESILFVTNAFVGPVISKTLGKLKDIGIRVAEPTRQALVDLAESYGISFETGEVTGGASLKAVEQTLSNIPVVGLGKFNLKQAEAVDSAVQKLQDKFTETASNMNFAGVDDIREAAKAGSYTANKLLNSIGSKFLVTARLFRTSMQGVNDV